jgi:hypothetical protein
LALHSKPKISTNSSEKPLTMVSESPRMVQNIYKYGRKDNGYSIRNQVIYHSRQKHHDDILNEDGNATGQVVLNQLSEETDDGSLFSIPPSPPPVPQVIVHGCEEDGKAKRKIETFFSGVNICKQNCLTDVKHCHVDHCSRQAYRSESDESMPEQGAEKESFAGTVNCDH